MKCKAELTGLTKVIITDDVGGWPIGFIGWHDGNNRVYDDNMTDSWAHTIGDNCEIVQPSNTTQSPTYYLNQAAKELSDRASTYDNPEGERSMGATVEAFNAITGHNMTEEQGWMFMAVLKAVRSQQGDFKADNYIDGAAYFALAAETAYKVRG